MKPVAIAAHVLVTFSSGLVAQDTDSRRITELIADVRGDIPDGWEKELVTLCRDSRPKSRLAIDGLARVVADTPPTNLPALLRVTGDLAPLYGDGVFDMVVEDIIHPIERDIRPMSKETRSAILAEIFRTRELIFIDALGSVESLAEGLGHWSSHLRVEVASLLGERGTKALPALSTLHNALESEHPTVKELVDFSLLPNGQLLTVNTRPVSHDSAVRTSVARAIVRIASDAPPTRSAYLFLLTHGDPEERRVAAMTLAQLGPDSKALTALVAALSEEDPVLVREAITAIGMMGSAAKDAIPALEEFSKNDDPQIAERAKAALRQIRGRRDA